jgi:Holliday junction resolvase
MVNAKKKGNAGENQFATFLRSHGFKAFRDSASGGSTHKSDIVNGLDYSMEVKTVKKLNLKACWRQVSRDSSIAHNSPLLAIHLDGMPENEWIIGIHSNDWIELEKTARQQPKIEPTSTNEPQYDREIIYALQQLKSQINRVSKLLENNG